MRPGAWHEASRTTARRWLIREPLRSCEASDAISWILKAGFRSVVQQSSCERASKFKGSKAEVRQGVSPLGLGIASSGNLRTFYTGVSPTHVCCSARWASASGLDFH